MCVCRRSLFLSLPLCLSFVETESVLLARVRLWPWASRSIWSLGHWRTAVDRTQSYVLGFTVGTSASTISPMFASTNLQLFSHVQCGEILWLNCFVSHLVFVDTTQAVQRSSRVDFCTVGVSFVSAVPCREHIVTDLEGGCQFVFLFFRWRFLIYLSEYYSNAHAYRVEVTATSVAS